MQRHQRHEALVVAARVGVGHQRDLLQEHVQRVLLRGSAGVELAPDLDQLLEVLDAPLGLDRALGLQRLDVAGLREQRLEQIPTPTGDTASAAASAARRSSAPIVSMKRRSALTAAAPRPGTCSGCGGGLPHRAVERGGVREHARERGLADAAPGRVGHAREADHVERVGQQRQVGDRVLDLGAFVELGAADHLVGDLAAHERVLDHPRHRVRAVQHGDLRARGALVDEALDLADHEPRLGVLVLERAQLDLIALPQLAPQPLGDPAAVVRDHRVGGRQDRLGGAVVLLELDHARVGEVLLEVEDVADVGLRKL